jgi:DNA-binding transcriptional ArsR family regulator
MSAAVMKWAREQKIADPTLLLTLRALAWLADKNTDTCRKSQAIIAAEAGLRDRAVRDALVLLEQMGLIKRARRSKGKYGRDIDEIHFPVGDSFNVSKATVRVHRKSLRPPLQPARGAASTKSSNRHDVPLQPARGAGEYNTVDTDSPYQEGRITEVEGSSTTPPDPDPHDRGSVIRFPARGAA